MIVINKKKISLMLLVMMLSISTFLYNKEESNIEKEQVVTATPVSNKVIVIDAGHR